ncbi:hypothetical protein D3C72_1931660 [compost metagenome]
MRRRGRALAHHVEHRDVKRTECLQGCGLCEQGMRPSADIVHRCGNWRLAWFGGLLPGSGTHPIVDKVLGGGVLVPCIEGGARASGCVADAIRLVRRGRLRIKQGKQRWLVEGQGAHAVRIRQGRDECDGGSV